MRVAISGAGIAGPTLAYWLCRSGHSPVLVEESPQLRVGGYMVDFWGLGYTVAERMGILPAILEAGYRVRQVRLVDGQGHQSAAFPADVFALMTEGRFTSLPRGDLARLIYQSLGNRVETLFGNRIASISQRDSDVGVSFEHGPARTFDLVIGADGLHSQVRQLAFGPETQFERELGYHVAAFEVSGYPKRDELVYVSHNTPGRMAARFSLRDDRTMFFFVFEDERMPIPDPSTPQERKQALAAVYADSQWECPEMMRLMERVDDFYCDRVSQIRMKSWSKGRVLLLGDAGCCVSLLAGEGSSLAMAEAYVLAGELNAAAGDYAGAFERYERKLRPLVESKQESARNFATAFVPKTRLGVWFRNLVARLLIVRPVAEYFVGRDLRDQFELPCYKM